MLRMDSVERSRYGALEAAGAAADVERLRRAVAGERIDPEQLRASLRDLRDRISRLRAASEIFGPVALSDQVRALPS